MLMHGQQKGREELKPCASWPALLYLSRTRLLSGHSCGWTVAFSRYLHLAQNGCISDWKTCIAVD